MNINSLMKSNMIMLNDFAFLNFGIKNNENDRGMVVFYFDLLE